MNGRFAIVLAGWMIAACCDAAAQEAFNPPKENADAQPGSAPQESEKPPALTEEQKRQTQEAKQRYRKKLDIARSEAGVEIQNCKRRYREGTLKTHAQVVNCFNPKVTGFFRKAGYPYPDLLKALADKRIEVARLIDKKIMTEAQAEAELAEFSATIAAEEQKRADRIPPH